MKTAILPLSLLLAALPVAAQTTHTAHHTIATTHHTISGACLTIPTLSPKIPTLPANAPCARALYTLTHTPDTKADYISPLVSPELRESLASSPSTYSLGYIDVLKGTGELARPGKFITVKYAGYLPNGLKFDASDDHPNKEPISFPYGSHRVIQGWDNGFEGMHVGGKRRIFIPYELGYGETAHGPIPAKAELVFDVELVGVSDKMPEPPHPAPKPTPAPSATKPGTPPPATSTTPPPAGTTPPAAAQPKK